MKAKREMSEAERAEVEAMTSCRCAGCATKVDAMKAWWVEGKAFCKGCDAKMNDGMGEMALDTRGREIW